MSPSVYFSANTRRQLPHHLHPLHPQTNEGTCPLLCGLCAAQTEPRCVHRWTGPAALPAACQPGRRTIDPESQPCHWQATEARLPWGLRLHRRASASSRVRRRLLRCRRGALTSAAALDSAPTSRPVLSACCPTRVQGGARALPGAIRASPPPPVTVCCCASASDNGWQLPPSTHSAPLTATSVSATADNSAQHHRQP